MEKDLYDVWWKYEGETEQSMEEEHQPHWAKVLASIQEKDLTGKRVLDFGCNQGGFLRLLYKTYPFEFGLGIDLATAPIAIAKERRGSLPLDYIATAHPENYQGEFDIAFSISVLYLIEDLEAHADIIRKMLKEGGIYYAAYSDYSQNPELPGIKKTIDQNAALPMQLHTLDEIAEAFSHHGFQCSIRRMIPEGFIPINPMEKWFSEIRNRMLYEYSECYLFRFVLKEKSQI